MSQRPAALITGSTRNIGRASALQLAGRGFDIALNGRHADFDPAALIEEIAGAGATSEYFPGDMRDEADVSRVVEGAAARFGRLDAVVINAAERPQVGFTEMSYREWKDVVHGQLDGLFLCARAALPHLKRSPQGRLVMIGGAAAHVGAKERAHVVTAKAGLIGFVRALAKELGPDGICVNAVVPATIDTTRDGAKPSHLTASSSALGREGRPEEVGFLVATLCDPLAGYVTGQAIHVNGGSFLST